MPRRNSQASNRGDVTGKGQAQRTRSQIPDFDCSISGAACKPLVSGFYCQASHPTQMSRNHTHEFPRCMPFWFRLLCSLLAYEACGRKILLQGGTVGTRSRTQSQCGRGSRNPAELRFDRYIFYQLRILRVNEIVLFHMDFSPLSTCRCGRSSIRLLCCYGWWKLP